GTLQQNYLKTISVIITRDFSLSSCQNHHSTINKNNVNLALLSINHKNAAVPQIRLMSADHSKLWPIEKGLGLEAVVVDYVRPIIFGNIIPKLSVGLLYLISAATLGGLIYFNVNDIGIGKAIRRFWAIKK
ncbi:succinate dehydrogenase [ubiquinone] cytochrome b small subunit, mitochondrial, partial [Asbolus verrucosus]